MLRVHHLPAINVDCLAGDVRRVIRGEEDGHRGEFRGRLPASDFRLACPSVRGSLPLMNKLTIEISDEVAARLEFVSVVQNVLRDRCAIEAVARAFLPHIATEPNGRSWRPPECTPD